MLTSVGNLCCYLKQEMVNYIPWHCRGSKGQPKRLTKIIWMGYKAFDWMNISIHPITERIGIAAIGKWRCQINAWYSVQRRSECVTHQISELSSTTWSLVSRRCTAYHCNWLFSEFDGYCCIRYKVLFKQRWDLWLVIYWNHNPPPLEIITPVSTIGRPGYRGIL